MLSSMFIGYILNKKEKSANYEIKSVFIEKNPNLW